MSCTALADEQGSDREVEVFRLTVWAESGPAANHNAPIHNNRPAGKRFALPEAGWALARLPGEVSRNMEADFKGPGRFWGCQFVTQASLGHKTLEKRRRILRLVMKKARSIRAICAPPFEDLLALLR